eukprot:sb/3465358/
MLAPLPLRYATDPDFPSPTDTADTAELISRERVRESESEREIEYLPISKTTILTKQLNIKAEFDHVDIVLCEERPQYQQDMLTNYFTMATEGNNTETPEQLESKMYLICKFLSSIPQHPKHENVYRLSSVTATGTGSDTLRKRIASEESSATVITSATSTIKSTKSNASSLKAFKKCFHRRFASTSNIESKKSPPCLELQKKCSSVGSLPDTIAERKSVKRTIIRRRSRREVRRNPNFCMVSCFGLKTGATACLLSRNESSSPGEGGNDSDYYSMDSLNKVKYRSLEDFHVFVLANVLYRPIIVVAMSHLYSQDNQDLLAPIYFGGIYLPLERDPRQCFQTPLILAYDSSHFCPLLPMSNGDPFIPLVDCMLAPLPLRYATDPDFPSPTDTADTAELISR